jgi:K+ transporter
MKLNYSIIFSLLIIIFNYFVFAFIEADIFFIFWNKVSRAFYCGITIAMILVVIMLIYFQDVQNKKQDSKS